MGTSRRLEVGHRQTAGVVATQVADEDEVAPMPHLRILYWSLRRGMHYP